MALQQKLVISTTYGSEAPVEVQGAGSIHNLFRGLLQISDANIQCLTDELVALRDGHKAQPPERTQDDVAKIYEALTQMVTTDDKQSLR